MLSWVSQLIGALGLLIVFSLHNKTVGPRARLYAITPVFLFVVLISWLIFRVERWEINHIESLSPYILVINLLLYATAIIVILMRNRVVRPASMLMFVQALLWLFLAKLEELFGYGLYSLEGLFGDAFKLVGYYYLLKGVYYVLIDEPHKQHKRTESRINYLAYHDELTGLPNRRLFVDRVSMEMERSKKEKTQFALLWMGLDRFKTINDSMGHAFGDRLLIAVAQRLNQYSNKSDNIFRMGGDEFTTLLVDIGGDQEAEQAARELVELFDQPLLIGLSVFHISISVGVALYPGDGLSPDLLLQNADTALHSAKRTRNNWKRYTMNMNRQAKDKLLLENDLRRALELDQFHIVYQPLINLENDYLVGAEALLRWSHPQRGDIQPAEFIPICEENGFILQLGEWVLYEACQQMKVWHDKGYPAIIMSVNLSIRQFRQHDLCERIAIILEETGLEPACLELEITESIMADVTFATEMLNRLKQLGIRISIDDFGTGYSSLSYLKRFPIDKLKIDRSFVNDILTDRSDVQLYRVLTRWHGI